MNKYNNYDSSGIKASRETKTSTSYQLCDKVQTAELLGFYLRNILNHTDLNINTQKLYLLAKLYDYPNFILSKNILLLVINFKEFKM